MSNELEKHIARLESKLDLLESELFGLDGLLKEGGFTGGVQTLKSAVHEFLGREIDEHDDDEDDLEELFS